MTDYSDAAIMNALRREMTRAVARQVASSSNLANLETPGYKTRDAAFGDTLDAKLGPQVTLATTAPGHLAGAPMTSPTSDSVEVQGLGERRDGNNVQLDRELLNMTRASQDFAKAQTALAAKFRLVKYALSEGK